MFDSAYVNNSIGMNTPYTPYTGVREDFFGTVSDHSSFRQLRPGVYLLSDLFTAGFQSRSEFVKDKKLVTLARDKTMTFTGEPFDQFDLDVLLHCVTRTSVVSGRSEKVAVEPCELLRDMGLRNCEANRDRLFSSLWRLHMGSLMIEGKGYRYMTRLIDRVLLDEHKGSSLVEVNTDVVSSLRNERNLSQDVTHRICLKRNGLAKWLHGAIMSFKGGLVADLDCLHALCGAPARSRKTFPKRLSKALDVMAGCDAVRHWEMQDNNVLIVPNSSRRDGSACGYISPSLF